MDFSKITPKIRARVIEEAKYTWKKQCTLEETVSRFGVSKSTVHNDLDKRLYFINKEAHKKLKGLRERNFEDKSHRGGVVRAKLFKNT